MLLLGTIFFFLVMLFLGTKFCFSISVCYSVSVILSRHFIMSLTAVKLRPLLHPTQKCITNLKTLERSSIYLTKFFRCKIKLGQEERRLEEYDFHLTICNICREVRQHTAWRINPFIDVI
jgi:hypothetical protein